MTLAALADPIITIPPRIVLKVGFSPRTRNTHTGLKTGSIRAIKLADTAVTRLIPYEKNTDANPIFSSFMCLPLDYKSHANKWVSVGLVTVHPAFVG